jgi:hypothetical protein
MSFWASSYSFRLKGLRQLMALVRSGPVRVSFTTIVRIPARCFLGLLFLSIESFDAMLGRVPATNVHKPRPEL